MFTLVHPIPTPIHVDTCAQTPADTQTHVCILPALPFKEEGMVGDTEVREKVFPDWAPSSYQLHVFTQGAECF